MEKLMDYDSQPFKLGDLVECIFDGQPGFYKDHWIRKDGISKGDRLEVVSCESEESFPGWQWWVTFANKEYGHSARLFKLVEPENSEESVTPSERLESALKFLETSGDVLQALKIAAGVR